MKDTQISKTLSLQLRNSQSVKIDDDGGGGRKEKNRRYNRH